LGLDDEDDGPDDVPESVGSSEASSILERPSFEDHDDTFGRSRLLQIPCSTADLDLLPGLPLRLGAVEAVTTPPAVVHDHQAFRPISFVADHVDITEQAANIDGNLRSEETQRIVSHGSLAPPIVSAEPTRSSYMTTTTDGSRMSGLSDFPEPPPVEHLNPAHMSIIHSYFGEASKRQVEEPLSNNQSTTPENRTNASHRLTFGGSEDMESIGNFVLPTLES
jgi:hypothetical protein